MENQQNNQGLMQHIQTLISGLFPHHQTGELPAQDTTAAGPSEPPPYEEAVREREMTPVDGAISDATSAPAGPSTSSALPPRGDDYDSDDSMPPLQAESESSDDQDTQDVEMMTLPESQSSSTSEPIPIPVSRPPSSTRNSRRARVEDEIDEDDLRETNRQRLHSPTLSPSGLHQFHPDMDAHRDASTATSPSPPPQTQHGPHLPPPPLFSHVTYVVDLLPPRGPAGSPPAAGASGPQAQGAIPAPFFFPFPPTSNNDPTAEHAQPAAPGTDPNAPPSPMGADGLPTNAADFYAFLNTLRERFTNMTMPWGVFSEDEQDDPIRAQKLLSGLEEVPEGLIKRMDRVGGDEGEKPVCAVCFEGLLGSDGGGFEPEHYTPEPEAMEVEGENASSSSSTPAEDAEQKKLEEALRHKIVVLPCSHVFHATCLLPWFTRPHRTTCPTCRFDIDPESLTLTPAGIRRPQRRQQPPQPTTGAAAAPGAAPTAEAGNGPAPAPTPAAAPMPDGLHVPPFPPQAQQQPLGAGPGPVPRAHARRTIRTVDMPFGLVVDVSVFPGPMPPSMFGPAPPPTAQNPQPHPPQQQQQAQGQNIPFFGMHPPPPAPAAAGAASNAPPTGNTRPFNPGMAGIGVFPTEMQFFFGPPMPGPHPPAANNGANANAPNPAPAPAAPAQTPGAQPQPQQTGPQIHIEGPNASALLADLLGLGRFQPQPQPQPQPAQTTPGAEQAQAQPQQPRPQQPLPSFQEFINMIGLPGGAMPGAQGPTQPGQPAAPAEGVAQQPQPQEQRQGQPEMEFHWHAVPPTAQEGDAHVNAMADNLARTLFQQIVFSAQPPTAGPQPAVNANAPPVPPGPIPFTIPVQDPHRRSRGPAPEKRQWTPPPPPGATLRERVERKEREMGLRCSDISCGLGPTDEDPVPVVDPRAVRQIYIRPLPGKGDPNAHVCEHQFHPACLVSAERVAGWSGADQKREVEGEEDVEVSCPVCRAVGCISHEDWDEGACALA